MRRALAFLALGLCACERHTDGSQESDESRVERINAMRAKATELYSEKQVSGAINVLAQKLNEKFRGTTPIFVCVLKGAIPFCGQLLTKLTFDPELDCVRVSSYSGTKSGKLKWHMKSETNCAGRTVILCDDCLDTGKTLAALVQHYKGAGAKEVYTVVLIDKVGAQRLSDGLQHADFVGLTAPAEHYLIGVGLDGDGFMRNLPCVYAVGK
jgi:hypoxanthine phosphoribosyltransferase